VWKPSRVEEIVYKVIGKIKLKLTLYHPEESGMKPGIVFFGGGAWMVQDPKQFRPHSIDLARAGFLGATAEYRTSGQHGATPLESVRDAISTVRWLRLNSERIGLDPRRVAASGGSAGGHIAACAATLTGFDEEGEDTGISSVPDALVLYNPVLDPADEYVSRHLLEREEVRRMNVQLEEISPMRVIRPGVPPTIIFHGTEDQVVPFAQAERFKVLMEGVGSRCVLVPAEGEGHGFFNYRRSKHWYRETMEATREFLHSCFGGASPVSYPD
jgi:acetyl esterase/lipase